MKKALTLTIFAMSAACLSSAAVTFDFTAAEGFTEDVTIGGIGNWQAQPQWVAKDVAGAGYAFSAADFHRATLFNNNAWNVGDSYTLVAELSLVDSSLVNTKTSMFQFGLTNQLSPGSNSPKVGMTVRPAFLNFFIDANISVGGQEVSTGVAKDNNTHTYTTVITKTAVANTFDVTIDFDGSTSASFSVVDATLYGATDVYPIIDTYQANTKGGIKLESFSSTYTAVPEPGTIAFLMGFVALGAVVYRRKMREQ